MTLSEDLESFRVQTSGLLEAAEEIQSQADYLPECSMDELSTQMNSIQDACEDLVTQILEADEKLKAIAFAWGFANFVQQVNIVADKILKRAITTGKNLQTSLTIISSLTGVSLTTIATSHNEVISPLISLNSRIVNAKGMPISDAENSSVAILNDLSEEVEERHGMNSDVADWYEMQHQANHEASSGKSRRRREEETSEETTT